jgi:hypothetical protein
MDHREDRWREVVVDVVGVTHIGRYAIEETLHLRARLERVDGFHALAQLGGRAVVPVVELELLDEFVAPRRRLVVGVAHAERHDGPTRRGEHAVVLHEQHLGAATCVVVVVDAQERSAHRNPCAAIAALPSGRRLGVRTRLARCARRSSAARAATTPEKNQNV